MPLDRMTIIKIVATSLCVLSDEACGIPESILFLASSSDILDFEISIELMKHEGWIEIWNNLVTLTPKGLDQALMIKSQFPSNTKGGDE